MQDLYLKISLIEVVITYSVSTLGARMNES